MADNFGKYPYVSLAEAKNYLNITSNNENARLSNLIMYACGAVEHYVGYEILSNVHTDTFNGGTSYVYVNKLPLQDVYSIMEYDGTKYSKLNSPQTGGFAVDTNKGSYTINYNSAPVLKTRYKKFGTAAAFFDGVDDYLYIADSDDWYFSDSDFTIDLQIRSNSYSANSAYVSQVADSSNYWAMGYNTSLGYYFKAYSGGTEVINVVHNATTGYSVNTYHHVELVRNNSNFYLYRDGIEIGTQVTSNVLPDITGALEIARQNVSGSYDYYNGFVDELRVSHSARHVAAFTAPTYAYSTDDNTVLLVNFDGTGDTSSFTDSKSVGEDFVYNVSTGEISRAVGAGSGTLELSLAAATKFSNYANGVKITYKSGYETADVPYDIKLATLDYAKMLHKDRQESQMFSLQGENIQNMALSANFPPHIRRILDLYRIIN